MSDDLRIERDITLDAPIGEVWDLVSTAEGWQQWLVDIASVEFGEGSEGDVVDDGVQRHVRITEVVTDQRVSFQWWEGDDPSSMSEVVIDVSPHRDGGSVLRVVERCVQRPLVASASAASSVVWDRRLLMLALSFIALARV